MNEHSHRLRRLRDFALLAVGVPCLAIAALIAFAEIRYGSVVELYVTTRGVLYAGIFAAAGVLCAAGYALTRPPGSPSP